MKYASYTGRRKRPLVRLFQAVLALCLLGAACFAVLLGLVLGGARDQVSGQPEVLVILGCQVRSDGPSILLRDRLDTALDYLEAHPETVVVASGAQGAGEPVTEARAMADYLAERGVDRSRILLEEESFNTFQNLFYTRALLEEQGYTPSETGIMIVSNGFHLTRAAMLANRLGFGEVSTLAAPSSHFATTVKMLFREPLALVKSFVFDRE